MAKKEIKLDGVAGIICVRCDTVVLVFVHGVNYTARLAKCPAVDERGYFCEAPMRILAITDIDDAVASYHALNLAPKGGADSDGDGHIGLGEYITCPSCKSWNWDDEPTCFQCGGSLDPKVD